MLTRFLITVCLIAATALAPLTGAASELLARADLTMPGAEVFDHDSVDINKVLVRKSERRLYLMDDDQVVKSYRISLGDNPEGHKLYEATSAPPRAITPWTGAMPAATSTNPFIFPIPAKKTVNWLTHGA